MKITIDKANNSPIYKQIVEYVVSGVIGGRLKGGELIPSMNELAASLGVSKETVKKAYAVLRDRHYIEPRQGKGFYIVDQSSVGTKRVLVIIDKISAYKQITLSTMQQRIGQNAQVTILLHNQSIQLLEYFLDDNLDLFDYYVITPHFPLDDETQKRVMKQLKRVPNRKLIMLDNWIREIPGNYGAIYQDFSNDIYDGLNQGRKDILKMDCLNVIILSSSLYHEVITASIRRFCNDNEIPVTFSNDTSHPVVTRNHTYLLLNSQLDSGLTELVKEAEKKGLVIGKDIFIISYNDSPINELVLGGLTTVSADFAQMGRVAAEMILNQKMIKMKCNFKMTRRSTF